MSVMAKAVTKACAVPSPENQANPSDGSKVTLNSIIRMPSIRCTDARCMRSDEGDAHLEQPLHLTYPALVHEEQDYVIL